MSSRAPIGYERSPLEQELGDAGVPRSVRRRRAAATRAQRRRLLVIDLVLGLVLALIALALAPGLALVAIAASLILLVCVASLAHERLHRRRAARLARPDRPRSRVRVSRYRS